MNRIFHAGNIVLFGFAAMILFMSYLVFQCTQNPSIMVTQKYYEKELKFQDEIDAKSNGTEIERFLQFQHNSDKLIFNVSDSLNKQLQSIAVELYNMADDKKDKNLSLVPNKEGMYNIDLNESIRGNYKIKFNFSTLDKKYYKEYSVNL